LNITLFVKCATMCVKIITSGELLYWTGLRDYWFRETSPGLVSPKDYGSFVKKGFRILLSYNPSAKYF